MQKYYEPFHRQARDLEHKIQDLLDQPNHAAARSLRKEAVQLIDDYEVDKSPRNIESRIKSIQQILINSRDERIMNVEHSMFFKDRYEDMRLAIKRLPNY